MSRLGIDPELEIGKNPEVYAPELMMVEGCVFLSEEYARSGFVPADQFPDRTGYECFVNHTHLRGKDKEAWLQFFARVSALRNALAELSGGAFEIIVSASDDEITLRFHKCRAGETWLDDDIEQYAEEAVLVLDVHG